jgi:hypothetical protein
MSRPERGCALQARDPPHRAFNVDGVNGRICPRSVAVFLGNALMLRHVAIMHLNALIIGRTPHHRLAQGGTLGVNLPYVKRMACHHEETIALWSPEGDIGVDLGQSDAPAGSGGVHNEYRPSSRHQRTHRQSRFLFAA